MSGLLPSWGWHKIDYIDCYKLGLELSWEWEAFEFEWFGYGVMIGVRATKPRDITDVPAANDSHCNQLQEPEK